MNGNKHTAIKCASCGVHGEGVKTASGRLRCAKCGTFGAKAEQYCAEHDVHYQGLFPEDNHCPMCREEDKIRAQERHRVTRDPRVEPW